MVFRKLRRCRFLRRTVFLASGLLLILLYLNSRNLIFSATKFVLDVTEKCKEGYLEKFLGELCLNYTKGLVYGDMCSPLCMKRDIRVTSCIMHGTTLVLQGQWKRRQVVLKKKRGHSYPSLDQFEEGISSNGMALDSNKLTEDVRRFLLGQLQSLLGLESVKSISKAEQQKLLQELLFGKSPGEVSKMTRYELLSHMRIVTQDEYLMFTAFQTMKYFPQLIGMCGTMYGMEKLTPLNRINYNALPWTVRATIGREFLDLIQELERSRIGALSHCDIQEGNFGVSDNFKVKAIDVDLVFTEERINEILPQPNCTTSDDCDFFDCVSYCDARTNKCTSRKITNNLQVLCRDIFLRHKFQHGLLENSPSHIHEKLNSLLKFCSSQYFGVLSMKSKQVQNMIKELQSLLTANSEYL